MWRKNRRDLPRTAALWVGQLSPGGVPNPPFAEVRVEPPPGILAQYQVPDYDPPNRIPPNGPAHYRERKLPVGRIGVDLNRNCATAGWGYDCPIQGHYLNYDPDTDNYFGPSADSEVETGNIQQAMFQAANAGNPPGLATMIDYHSYKQAILYPTEAFNTGAVDPEYSSLGQTLQQLVRSHDALGYELGSPSALLGYDATGTVADHAVQQYQARAFTIELDPADQAGGGFQLDENQIQGVFEGNIRGALAAIAAPGNRFGAVLERLTIDQAERQFLSWNVYGRGNQLPA